MHVRVPKQVLAELVANFVTDNATSMFSEDSLPMVLWLCTSTLKLMAVVL